MSRFYLFVDDGTDAFVQEAEKPNKPIAPQFPQFQFARKVFAAS